MLRYKNSLLERILLEKSTLSGPPLPIFLANNETEIDVQAELKSKTEGFHSEGLPQPSPVQRALMNRQSAQVRRSTSGSESALQTRSLQASLTHSPRLQPTSPSQNLSPTLTKAPIGLGKGGVILPYLDLKAQQQQQQQPPSAYDPHAHSQQALSELSIPPPRLSMQTTTPSTADGSRNSKLDSTTTACSNFCPSPFQVHMKQLRKLSYPFPPLPFLMELLQNMTTIRMPTYLTIRIKAITT